MSDRRVLVDLIGANILQSLSPPDDELQHRPARRLLDYGVFPAIPSYEK